MHARAIRGLDATLHSKAEKSQHLSPILRFITTQPFQLALALSLIEVQQIAAI